MQFLHENSSCTKQKQYFSRMSHRGVGKVPAKSKGQGVKPCPAQGHRSVALALRLSVSTLNAIKTQVCLHAGQRGWKHGLLLAYSLATQDGPANKQHCLGPSLTTRKGEVTLGTAAGSARYPLLSSQHRTGARNGL